MIKAICRAHDAVTDLGYLFSVLSLLFMLIIFCAEVIVRYFVGWANPWANDMFANFMVVSIFAMLPHLTRSNSHISLTFILEYFPGSERNIAQFNGISGALVCGVVAWMSYNENLRQIAYGVQTMQNYPLPIVWWTAFITYGFGSSAIYFLRGVMLGQTCAPRTWIAAGRPDPSGAEVQ